MLVALLMMNVVLVQLVLWSNQPGFQTNPVAAGGPDGWKLTPWVTAKPDISVDWSGQSRILYLYLGSTCDILGFLVLTMFAYQACMMLTNLS